MANWGFYLGATNDNLDAVKAVDPHRACGIKVFMGSSTGNMLVDDERTLEGIFAAAPLLVATHCEHTPTILANEARAKEKYGEEIPFSEHPRIRSVEACHRSSSLAVELARRHGTRLHVLHLTTARELGLFEPGDLADKRITAEACVHHLFFDDTGYATLGARIKCNPAIKTAADRDALWAAVNDGRIDVIATDHAPHTAAEKARPYAAAPAGLPLVQHALLVLFEQVRSGRCTVATVVEKTAHAPARLFDIRDRGFIREGYWADLALVDPAAGSRDEPILAKCGWSPFTGFAFSARVRATWVKRRAALSRRPVPPRHRRARPGVRPVETAKMREPPPRRVAASRGKAKCRLPCGRRWCRTAPRGCGARHRRSAPSGGTRRLRAASPCRRSRRRSAPRDRRTG